MSAVKVPSPTGAKTHGAEYPKIEAKKESPAELAQVAEKNLKRKRTAAQLMYPGLADKDSY